MKKEVCRFFVKNIYSKGIRERRKRQRKGRETLEKLETRRQVEGATPFKDFLSGTFQGFLVLRHFPSLLVVDFKLDDGKRC